MPQPRDVFQQILGDAAAGNLHHASRNGHAEIVAFFLSPTSADVNTDDYHGMTALHRAAQNGNYEISKVLLDKEGIDVNAVSDSGNTALHFAAQKDHVAVVELLLQNPRVKFNIRNQAGRTAVQLALDCKCHRAVKAFMSYYGCHLHREKEEINKGAQYNCRFCDRAKKADQQFLESTKSK